MTQGVTLNNAVQMPIVGFGVYQIPPEDTEGAATDALEVNHRHVDLYLDVFDFTRSDDEVARITALDTGSSAFFDHRDPAMVRRLNATRS